MDGASARRLVAMGFEALATSSAALAWTLGRRDGGIGLEEAIAHAAMIAPPPCATSGCRRRPVTTGRC